MKYGLGKRASLKWLEVVTTKRVLVASVVVCACLLFIVIDVASSRSMQKKGQTSCSDGWYITGYYVPREQELPDATEEINVNRVGNLSFSQKFLSETRTEGWGITRFGWALGYYGGGWHRSDAGPLDAAGNLLKDGAIAIDRSVIPPGAQVQISTLPNPWASKVFRATDIGVGIVGQHIDVFTGVGLAAEQETFRITSDNNRVCATTTEDVGLLGYIK